MFLQEWGGDGSRSRAPAPRDQGRGSQEGLFTLRSWGARPLQDKRRLPSKREPPVGVGQSEASVWTTTTSSGSKASLFTLSPGVQSPRAHSPHGHPERLFSNPASKTAVEAGREPGSLTLSGAPARTLCEERSPREAEPGNAQPAPQEKNHLQGP